MIHNQDMKTEQKPFIEYWTEDVASRSTEFMPASMMPFIQECIEEELKRLIWLTEFCIDDVERKLHRLDANDPLLARAIAEIAAERTARATEGPTERVGRQAMLNIYKLSTIELAARLDEIKAGLFALSPESPVRVAGEKALSGRERMLEQVRDRITVGDSPWTTPEAGQPLKVGDGFTLDDKGERLTYAITAASPGKDGKPNALLAALGNMLAADDAGEASKTPPQEEPPPHGDTKGLPEDDSGT